MPVFECKFFIQILFIMVYLRTTFTSVSSMFGRRKLVLCFYRSEQIIPHFCSFIGDNLDVEIFSI